MWPPLHWQYSHKSLPGSGTMAVHTCIQWMSQHRNYTNIMVGVPPWLNHAQQAWAGTPWPRITQPMQKMVYNVSIIVSCSSTKSLPNYSMKTIYYYIIFDMEESRRGDPFESRHWKFEWESDGIKDGSAMGQKISWRPQIMTTFVFVSWL